MIIVNKLYRVSNIYIYIIGKLKNIKIFPDFCKCEICDLNNNILTFFSTEINYGKIQSLSRRTLVYILSSPLAISLKLGSSIVDELFNTGGSGVITICDPNVLPFTYQAIGTEDQPGLETLCNTIPPIQ